MSTKVISMIVLGVCAVACGSSEFDPIDGAEGEADPSELALTKPKAVPLGSLGGPCGKNYVNCPTTESMVNTFRSLPKTSISAKCSITNSKDPKKIRRGVLLKFQVPRLVNDTKETKDQIEVEYIEATEMSMTYKRNGVQVARGHRNYHSDSAPDVTYDARIGALETLLTYDLDRGLQLRVQEALEKCDNTKLPVNAKPGYFCAFNDECAWCYFGRGTGAAVIGSLAAAGGEGIAAATGAVLGREAVTAIGGALGAAAGSLINDWSCTDTCKRGECKMKFCECMENKCSANACSTCREEFGSCCMRASGDFIDDHVGVLCVDRK